jgi:cell wall-associated NlpC family hydrolase
MYLRARHAAVVLVLAGSALALPSEAGAQVYLKRLLQLEYPEARPAPTVEDSVVTVARAQLGRRYRWGGERPETGFDCSGLMRHVLKAAGIELPRTSAEQARIGQPVPRDPKSLIPGDILTFGRGSRISHVGVYIGGGRYIHADSRSGMVTEAPVANLVQRGSSWWKGVRRVMTPPPPPEEEQKTAAGG